VFWNKKEQEKIEPTLIERVAKLEGKLQTVESQIVELFTSYDILRNKVLRKIQTRKEPEEEENATGWGGFPVN
jgi:chaperonin cofactor prefoldin